MPEQELARLITLNIGITLSVILAVVIGIWAIMREMRQIAGSTERVAEIAERIDARLRRQYADIDRDLREIKELLGGQ
jgi:hypothetical protein